MPRFGRTSRRSSGPLGSRASWVRSVRPVHGVGRVDGHRTRAHRPRKLSGSRSGPARGGLYASHVPSGPSLFLVGCLGNPGGALFGLPVSRDFPCGLFSDHPHVHEIVCSQGHREFDLEC